MLPNLFLWTNLHWLNSTNYVFVEKMNLPSLNASANSNNLVKVIIAANVTIYTFWQIALSLDSLKQIQIYRQLMYDHFTLSYDGVFNRGLYHTLLTSTFSHMNILHLVSNLRALISYGFIAKFCGPTKFLLLYLGGGVMSSLFQIMYDKYDSSQTRRSLGASGAISALKIWISLRAPKIIIGVDIYGPVVKMTHLEYGLLMFLFDVIGMTTGVGIPLSFEQLILNVVYPKTIGYAAHVGGALYGAIASLFML